MLSNPAVTLKVYAILRCASELDSRARLPGDARYNCERILRRCTAPQAIGCRSGDDVRAAPINICECLTIVDRAEWSVDLAIERS